MWRIDEIEAHFRPEAEQVGIAGPTFPPLK